MESFEDLLEMASNLLGNPDSMAALQEANDLINQALMIRPDNGDAWLLKSQIMSSLEDDPSALASAEMALRRLPRNPEALYTRAAVLADMERYPEALTAVERAFRCMSPEEGWLEEDLFFLKGALQDALGREEEALLTFEQGLGRHPNSELLRGGLEPLKRERMRRHLTVIDGGRG